ncbi:uncharacterized protein TRIADDRAFT_64277 [Trichoplax adhaerens]|uniref:glycerol-3-phosphate dehydrogenase n=1 Tax=Trichoplax adhaerens TaxID=10228 RepID=B3S890_TRIAD|nr:hypothetical protein TRIADDRAFT_64277 [Trichoplax adhaerens]EDV21156.1 hypothetical protein TRIADDRAFT_64277 [Trichoplax adhaerens]|eukprot:XP_002116486.1 hypothetical protein TRIADDRAFT_64277 [Trichoplax adhaerens]
MIRILAATGIATTTGLALYYSKSRGMKASRNTNEQLQSLKDDQFDVLVVGCGATGAGIALDSASRGLKTAVVEREDFASGTSSRSTKLIHGGVRYLKSAILHLDLEQYQLVREALSERWHLLHVAPHLTRELPIIVPVFKWYLIPYYWTGMKMYDFVSGKKRLPSSYFLSKQKALKQFPMLKSSDLAGAIVYYDGQHNDARMNTCIALTAARYGATVANHVEVKKLLKKKQGDQEVVCGATVKDNLTGDEWDVQAKCVINATGPFTDGIRQLDNPSTEKIVVPSLGVHVVLPGYYSPKDMGLLDPETSDGRVIFFLPWEGFTIAGTTDRECKVTSNPAAVEEDIQFILNEISTYLSPDVNVRRGDVLAAWAGIRPLVQNPQAKNTSELSRSHVIEVSDSNLISIAGGKWTTYRAMAKDTVDKAITVCGLSAKNDCITENIMLEGGENYTKTLSIRLVQDYGLDPEVGSHLADTYGDRAPEVAKHINLTGKRYPITGIRLVEGFPYIEAEIKHAIRDEYCCSIVDFIARRTSLAFLNARATDAALPRISELMSKELNWSRKKQKEEEEKAHAFLKTMGYRLKRDLIGSNISLDNVDVEAYKRVFKDFDRDGDGHISPRDLRKLLEKLGKDVGESEVRDLISEVDVDNNSMIELDEFLKLMSALEAGLVSESRLGMIVKMQRQKSGFAVPISRSGGGV